jgi:hypothetical protein
MSAAKKVEAVKPFVFSKSHWLPIDNPRHTEVLGYRVSTKHGKWQWDILDWSEWWLDGTTEGHIFSAPNSAYFHVKVRDDSDHDGCVFRVRCWYAGGTYKGREVASVSIGCKGGTLHWIVRMKAAEPTKETK